MRLPFRFLRTIHNGIMNLLYWFPIIWKDRNWDHHFLFVLLRHKLQSMEKFFRGEDAWSLYGERDADNIKKCILLIDRILEQDYSEMAFKKHDEKWGEIQMDFKPDRILNIYRPNVTPENKELERKENSKCHEHEDYLAKQDLEYLFHLLVKYVRCWWD